MGRFDESKIQQSIVRWARMADCMYPELSLLHAIPNGAKVSDKNRMRLAAEGVLPGVPDLFLPVARGGYNGLYIEVKTETGRLSAAQKKIIALLTKHEFRCIIVRSSFEAIELIEEYLKSS